MRFFHTSALIRRRRNRIVCLKDNLGNWIQGDNEVANQIRSGFIKLFSSSVSSVPRMGWNLSSWPSFLGTEDVSTLCANVTILEVKEGLWSLKPLKALGPDGIHAGVFQTYW